MIAAKSISFRYPHGPWLFTDLSLEAKPGVVLAILGPNARGKTTLLSCLAGIRKPVNGQVRCTGRVGYVAQAHGRNTGLSALEMVVIGRASSVRAWSRPSDADYRSAAATLDRVGIAHIAQRPFVTLSGGQQQLVLIARALVADPKMVVMDEPATALDLRNETVVLDIISSLSSDGIGVIFTTHNPAHAFLVADRAMLMYPGERGIHIGDVNNLLTETNLTELYRTVIQTPQVQLRDGCRTLVVAIGHNGAGTREETL